MAYAFVNQLDYSVTGGGGSATLTSSGGAGVGTLALTAGNWLWGVVFGAGGSAAWTGVTLTDSLGNSYPLIGTGNNGLASTYIGVGLFGGPITYAGTATFTATSTDSLNAIYCEQVSGLSNVIGNSAFLGPGSGSNGIGANTIALPSIVVSTASMVFSFAMDAQTSGTPYSAGTTLAWTGRTTVWGVYAGSGTCGTPEDIAASANTIATFGSVSANEFDNVYAVVAAVPLAALAYGDGTSASNTVVTTGTGGAAMPAITSGQVLDIVLMAETGSALTDSGPVWVGTSGGSFTNIQTISSTGYIFDHWQCVVTTSVALPVIKTTWSGGTPTKAGIAVVPNNGVLISNPISAGNYNVNHQVTPTGTDGQVSGNTTNPLTTGLLYLMGSYGFSFGQASAPTAGTGFASIATMWASLGSGACLNYETRTLTGAGAVAQATFTPVGGSDSMTVMAVFNSSFVPLMGQACL